MFTAFFYNKFKEVDYEEMHVGTCVFETEEQARRYYFGNGNEDKWTWNENKKRYEGEFMFEDFDGCNDDLSGEKFITYGIIVELPDIDIS